MSTIDVSSLFDNIYLGDETDYMHDVDVLVFFYTTNAMSSPFKVPLAHRKYDKITSIMKQKYPSIFNIEYLEFMPLIDEYLSNSWCADHLFEAKI